MTSKSKIKGNKFERDIVNTLRQHGIDARRAWGSDGRSIGLDKDTDIVFNGFQAQLKIRKRLPKVFLPPDRLRISILREDRGWAYVVLTLNRFIDLILTESRMLNTVVVMIDALMQDPQTNEDQRAVLRRLRELVKSILPLWFTERKYPDEGGTDSAT